MICGVVGEASSNSIYTNSRSTASAAACNHYGDNLISNTNKNNDNDDNIKNISSSSSGKFI